MTGDPVRVGGSPRRADGVSVLITHDGSGHTAYRKGSDCIDDAVDDYLIDGTVPEDGLPVRMNPRGRLVLPVLVAGLVLTGCSGPLSAPDSEPTATTEPVLVAPTERCPTTSR